MPRVWMILVLSICATPGQAVEADVSKDRFIDDYSSPETLITSLYNAINRREYLRAWSYFRDGAAAPLDDFSQGYEQTESVKLKVGSGTSEGAAGSIHYALPVAIEVNRAEGEPVVYSGCYWMTQVQPAAQIDPPYRHLTIGDGKLIRRDGALENVEGECQSRRP